MVLNLVEDTIVEEKDYLFLDIDDGVPISNQNLIEGVEFLLSHFYEKKVILILCGEGVSRSATFCTVLIKEIEKLTLLESYKSIKKKYPAALPHPELWKSVCEIHEEPFEYTELIKD